MERTATLDKLYAPATVTTAEVVTHGYVEALPLTRSHEIANPRRRSTIASRSCCCIAFGHGKAHERQIAKCSPTASTMLDGDCLGSRSGFRADVTS